MKRADAARKLADEASQRDADLREDLGCQRLENREQQLQAAAAEITRGNAIIAAVGASARPAAEATVRADVVKQQRAPRRRRPRRDSAKHERISCRYFA